MDNAGYVALSRQVGLAKDMRIIANNIANMSSDGFRRESAVFTEIVDNLGVAGGSLSQTASRVRTTDFSLGGLRSTGGEFDFAIEGEGFFRIETAEGEALTRNGSFARSADGELVTASGRRVLGAGGVPLFFPADATAINVGADGIISADGQPVGQLEIVTVEDLSDLRRREDGLFETDQPSIPAIEASLRHGFVERSNVDPVREMTRMIEVQRAYEMGQSFLETEDERIRQAVRIMGAGS
ncbi:MAG: flagellar hook-basal body complex protein [Pseudomonadota bacterium]